MNPTARALDSVLPLSLFQPNDPKQLAKLYRLVGKLPQLSHYYLRQHVFPACMNFQATKISACGHELGSRLEAIRVLGGRFAGTVATGAAAVARQEFTAARAAAYRLAALRGRA